MLAESTSDYCKAGNYDEVTEAECGVNGFNFINFGKKSSLVF